MSKRTPEPMTTADVADLYGITRRRVAQLAQLRGITGRKIGTTFVWTRDQVKALKPRPTGRPKENRR